MNPDEPLTSAILVDDLNCEAGFVLGRCRCE